MRIAYKSALFLFVFCQIVFAGSVFGNFDALQSNYKAVFTPQAVILSDEESDSDIAAQEQEAEQTEDGAINTASQVSSQEVVIVDLFLPKDDLNLYKEKYLRNANIVGTARFFYQSSIERKHITDFAASVSADIVLFKVIDFSKHRDAEERYYYDLVFLSSNEETSSTPNLNAPWRRTSSELESFSAPTSMFQFLDEQKRVFIKEQSRIMVEYNLKTQVEFDKFIEKYLPKKEEPKKEPVEQQQTQEQKEGDATKAEGAALAEGDKAQQEEVKAPEQAVVADAKVQEAVVNEAEKGSEVDILGLQDLYFTSLEGRWVDVATGIVFDIIALTDYNENYQGYDEYEGSAPKVSLYEFDSSKKSISKYSPASLQENANYVVYTAYYVGSAMEEVKKYNNLYSKKIKQKIKFEYLKRTYNKNLQWQNEDLVLEFNTKTQSGVYLTENKVPVPATFKAFPHRGYIAVRMSSGDVRYLLPVNIAQGVTLPLLPESEVDEEGNVVGIPEGFQSKDYYDPYSYDKRFNEIVYLDKVPVYRTSQVAKGVSKDIKGTTQVFAGVLIPAILIFVALTVVL